MALMSQRLVPANARIAPARLLISAPCRNAAACKIRMPRNACILAALKVGDKLDDYPDYFRVIKASDGSNVTLSSFKGKKPVVLFFYPKAGTPGCTKEACKFRDEYEDFVKAGAAVFGISSDSPEDNAAFAKAQRLPFLLLTDANSLLRKSFGIKADFFGALAGRQTFVIDKKGTVVLSFNSQLEAEKHVTEALKALQGVPA